MDLGRVHRNGDAERGVVHLDFHAQASAEPRLFHLQIGADNLDFVFEGHEGLVRLQK